jgi:hypothetical protein
VHVPRGGEPLASFECLEKLRSDDRTRWRFFAEAGEEAVRIEMLDGTKRGNKTRTDDSRMTVDVSEGYDGAVYV